MAKKKGIALGELVSIGLIFVLIGVTVGIGAYIQSTISQTAGWTNSTNDVQSSYITPGYIVKNATAGLANIASWLPIIGIVIAAGVIIAVLVRSFSMKRESEGI